MSAEKQPLLGLLFKTTSLLYLGATLKRRARLLNSVHDVKAPESRLTAAFGGFGIMNGGSWLMNGLSLIFLPYSVSFLRG